MTFQNAQVAKAKALLRYDSAPEAAEPYIWDHRAAIAAGGWRIEGSPDFWTKRAKSVLLGAGGGFIVTFGVLASLAWLWKFLLDRVRELSDAVRGK